MNINVSLLWIVTMILQVECQSVCTDLTNLPHLQNNYTMLGYSLSSFPADGLMSCLEGCKTELLCKAFTFDVTGLSCTLYTHSKHGSVVNLGPLLYSNIQDWTALDVDKNMMTIEGTSLVPGYDCYTMQGSHVLYNGTINTVVSGDTCQRWDTHVPHSHYYGEDPSHFNSGENMDQVSNYCRAPITDSPPIPWCYTENPDLRWDYCNVPECF